MILLSSTLLHSAYTYWVTMPQLQHQSPLKTKQNNTKQNKTTSAVAWVRTADLVLWPASYLGNCILYYSKAFLMFWCNGTFFISFLNAKALEHLLTEVYTRDRNLFWRAKSCISNRVQIKCIGLWEASKYKSVSCSGFRLILYLWFVYSKTAFAIIS